MTAGASDTERGHYEHEQRPKKRPGINGMTITRFMNYLIELHAEANAERYKRVKEIMRDE